MVSTHEQHLLQRIRFWTVLFIAGLVLSGVTAFPLETELRWLARWSNLLPGGVADWINRVYRALSTTNQAYPFLSYGTDWLAFGHLVIAVVFVGLWQDPVRNKWLLTFGLIACAGVIPLALIAGGARGIPIFWRCIDCSFGVFGAIPLLLCRRYVAQLEELKKRG